jgi:hypothetical protein
MSAPRNVTANFSAVARYTPPDFVARVPGRIAWVARQNPPHVAPRAGPGRWVPGGARRAPGMFGHSREPVSYRVAGSVHRSATERAQGAKVWDTFKTAATGLGAADVATLSGGW